MLRPVPGEAEGLDFRFDQRPDLLEPAISGFGFTPACENAPSGIGFRALGRLAIGRANLRESLLRKVYVNAIH